MNDLIEQSARDRILLLGIGAIGGLAAAALLKRGTDPTLVTGNANITQAINQRGLIVKNDGRSESIAAKAYTRISDLPADRVFGEVYILTKATQVVEVAKAIHPRLTSDATVVTLQNGYVEDVVAEVVGRERIVDGIIGFTGIMHEPGVCEQTSPGAWHIGELDGHVTERLKRVEHTLSALAPVERSRNIRGTRWSKLCLNCSITALVGLTGEPLASLLSHAGRRRVFFSVIREVVETGVAAGVRFEKLVIDPELFHLPSDSAWLDSRQVRTLQEQLILHYGRGKPSILQSLERGRPTEIDFINGYVSRIAQQCARPAYLNAAICLLIHEIESGARSICIGNIDDLDAGGPQGTRV